MSFLYPLGLLGLIGIPVLIIIYIIKSKYTEQVIPSTYLWTLSERFLKRKNPVSRLTGIISLILQILAVAFIALAIAHPVFVLPGSANDYCFILDGSGSMNAAYDGGTRFEEGKDRIEDIISSAADGSTFTLITTGNTTDVVFRNYDDKKSAIRQLNAVSSAYVASDFNNALIVAQNYFDANPAIKCYLITDKTYAETENVELINVGSDGLNRALDQVSYEYSSTGVKVTGTATSYGSNCDVTVSLYADGSSSAIASQPLQLSANEGKEFELVWDGTEFSYLKVALSGGDILPLDDEVTLYRRENVASYNTLIVSDTPFFINAALASLGNLQRSVVSPSKYTDAMGTGYGLYIFDGCTPSAMPKDGAVWFINPDASVEGSGFARRGEEELDAPATLKFNSSSSTKVRNLLKNTDAGEELYVMSYVNCRLYGNFTTVLSCGGDPVVFAGSNTYGNREVVFAFDFHKSDFNLTYNAMPIISNLINYTFPALVDDASFYCGDSMEVNVLAGCTGLRVTTPSGKAEYLDTSETSTEYELKEVGEYTVTATVGNSQTSTKVFCQLPAAERIPAVSANAFVISGQPSDARRDGRYEDLLYAFIVLAVLVAADWAVYCYEQYQLR